MTPAERGDLAERLLPVAARLACIVHGDGSREDIQHVLAQLDPTERDALIVVLAGLADPEQQLADALAYLTWDEDGRPATPPLPSGTVRALGSSPAWHRTGLGADDLITAEQKQQARALTARGYGPREIARRIGVHEHTVNRWKRAGGWWEPIRFPDTRKKASA